MPKTLLLADDSVTIQKVVGISFASEDIAIATVDNGDDAIAKARELRPDIILADVVMPGKSGYEVCEAIKADPNLRHTPVLLLTGTFEAFDEERASRSGAAGHVAKPFEAQTLVQRVKELLAAPPVAPPPPPAPAPAPAVGEAPTNPELGSDQAFDFFDDNAGDLSEAEPGPEAEVGDTSLDLDEPDAAFAFGDEDLSGAPSRPGSAPGRGLDSTVAFVPESASPAAAEPSGADSLDLGFETGGAAAAEAPVGSEDLAEATLLDPSAGSGFDVSSSDLARHESPAPETQILETREPQEMRMERDPVIDRLSPRAEPSASQPPQSPSPPIARPFGAEDSRPPRDLDVAEEAPLWSEAESADEPEPLMLEAEAEEPPVPMGTAEAPGAPSLSPGMRQELHGTLEKIAWDAFGPLAEKIVQQALERIEQVAWEVVPKLAEALIQEEIRRLKGGS